MNGFHRKAGTMLTADEVAAVSGGRSAQGTASDVASSAPAEGQDYPQNPAGPVTTDAEGTQFNRK
ncbi:MAG TPA: hypothetical protein VGI57_00170 [Usitatibacter sp.]